MLIHLHGRRSMAEILSTLRKTVSNQSINQYLYCHWEIKYSSVLLDSSTCLNTHQKDTDSAYSKLGRNQITH